MGVPADREGSNPLFIHTIFEPWSHVLVETIRDSQGISLWPSLPSLSDLQAVFPGVAAHRLQAAGSGDSASTDARIARLLAEVPLP